MDGTLFLVATPIGNLEDMTFRAVRVLKEADLIACEDTRTSAPLLRSYGIRTPVTSYHKFNEEEKSGELIGKMLRGGKIALITDAGMPAISDPGCILVRKCMEQAIPVTAVPGASACVTALALSGADTRRFVFEGFLPVDNKEKKEALSRLSEETRTIILYEAPHRLVRTLESLQSVLGEDRLISLCRELTKRFESVERMTLGDALRMYGAGEDADSTADGATGADADSAADGATGADADSAADGAAGADADSAADGAAGEHAEVRSDAGCAENAACTAKGTGRVGKASGVRPRGEYVLVIDGRNPEELAQKKAAAWETMDIAAHVALYEQKGMGRKEAMKAAARDRGLSRRDIYQALLHSPESEDKTE